MSDYNKLFINQFNLSLGGDIYSSKGIWYSKLHGFLFNEKGYFKRSEIDDILEPVYIEDHEEQLEMLKEKYETEVIKNECYTIYNNFDNDVYNRLIDYVSDKHNLKIVEVISETRIYKIVMDGKFYILKFIRDDEGTLSIRQSMNLHLEMSDRKIGPYISIAGILDYVSEYLYIIMNYNELYSNNFKINKR